MVQLKPLNTSTFTTSKLRNILPHFSTSRYIYKYIRKRPLRYVKNIPLLYVKIFPYVKRNRTIVDSSFYQLKYIKIRNTLWYSAIKNFYWTLLIGNSFYYYIFTYFDLFLNRMKIGNVKSITQTKYQFT